MVASGEGNTGESLLLVGVVGVVTTASGGGIGFRLNFAEGPSRSRIFAEEVLGEFGGGSGNDGTDGTFDTVGLRRFGGVERVVSKGEDGGALSVAISCDFGCVGDGEEFRVSEGEMSEAGTGGGGG